MTWLQSDIVTIQALITMAPVSFQEYVDNKTDAMETNKMKDYVGDMLSDLQLAHAVREKQLSDAAHAYRERLNAVMRTHEKMHIAYRWETPGVFGIYFMIPVGPSGP